jgi:hypothetical protein
VAALDAGQYAGIERDWFALWAREDQKPPVDLNWRNWLIPGGPEAVDLPAVRWKQLNPDRLAVDVRDKMVRQLKTLLGRTT